MSEIADRVKKIVVEHLGVEESKVTPEASFIDDLGADSLDTVELVMAFEEAFGVEIMPMEGVESYWSLQVGGRAVGGVTPLANDPAGTPAHWLTYFAVDDVDSTTDALVKRRGTVLAPPFDMPAGRMSVVTDPQGAPFALITPVPM